MRWGSPMWPRCAGPTPSRCSRPAGPWDLALADPPYAFDAWGELLDALDATIVVIESDHAVRPPSRWEVLRERRYGDTVVVIARSQDRDDRGRPNPEDRS